MSKDIQGHVGVRMQSLDGQEVRSRSEDKIYEDKERNKNSALRSRFTKVLAKYSRSRGILPAVLRSAVGDYFFDRKSLR